MQGLNLINEFGEMCALRAFRINHEAPRSRAIPTFAKWVPEIRENGYDFLNNIILSAVQYFHLFRVWAGVVENIVNHADAYQEFNKRNMGKIR